MRLFDLVLRAINHQLFTTLEMHTHTHTKKNCKLLPPSIVDPAVQKTLETQPSFNENFHPHNTLKPKSLIPRILFLFIPEQKIYNSSQALLSG